MHTQRTVLRIGKANGTVLDVPMRYNASHQRGYRCYLGDLAEAPEQITEATPCSFQGERLFDALAAYRKAIEPDGWRLLHAAARRDCWPRPGRFLASVERLTPGVNETETLDGLEPAKFAEVTTLEDQQAHFESWMKTLAPIPEGRVPPKAGHEHDAAIVEFGLEAIFAGQYLVDGKPNLEAALDILRQRHRGPWWNSKVPEGS